MEATEEDRNLTTEEVESGTPTIEEVKQTINKLKNNRAPGPDSINAELLKEGNTALIEKIHIIMERAWKMGKILQEWEEGIICSIFKKGDQLECSNYRGITLLNTAYKIFSNLLYERLQPHTEQTLGIYQREFRVGKSTSDQIHALRQILEKTHEHSVSMYHLFINFKAAYDSIDRDKLFEAMEEFQKTKETYKSD
jgi:sorting nexin-29